MKILIVGGSGVIGFKLVEYFNKINKDVECTYLTNKPNFFQSHYLDITNKKNVLDLISNVSPDVVVHTTALTNVDLCETDKKLAYSINVNGTKNILEGCKDIGSKVIYISTSFVFDGTKDQYFEEDKESPTTYYGITKFKGEQLVQNSDLQYLILRTDQPYCWTKKWQHTNSVIRVIDNLKKNQPFKEIVDWYNTPTYVPDFVNATKKLIQEDMEGIFHLVGPEFINRYEWSLKVADIFHLTKDLIKPINSSELKLPVKRNNVKLNTNKLFQKTGYRTISVEEGLRKMLAEQINYENY